MVFKSIGFVWRTQKMNVKECLKISVHKFVNLALIGAAVALIVTSIIQYNRWPIYTATNIVPQNKAQFPAITFCGLSKGYKEDVLQVIRAYVGDDTFLPIYLQRIFSLLRPIFKIPQPLKSLKIF